MSADCLWWLMAAFWSGAFGGYVLHAWIARWATHPVTTEVEYTRPAENVNESAQTPQARDTLAGIKITYHELKFTNNRVVYSDVCDQPPLKEPTP